MKWPKQITPGYVAQMIRAEKNVGKALGIFNSAIGEYPNGFKHNEDTFGLMIGRLAAAGQFIEAESLLIKMTIEKVRCPEDIFVTMCRAYGKAHRPFEALRTFHRMKDFECKPTVKSYAVIFAILVRENHLKLAFKFYDHMKKVGIGLNIYTYNILLKALCQKPSTLDRAIKVFREMPEKGFVPDAFSYNIIIDGLCKNNRVAEAAELVKEMDGRSCAPDVVTYSTLIHGVSSLGNVDGALELLQHMLANNVSPNVVTYTSVMTALCNAGRSLEALEFLRQMKSKGEKPNMHSFTTLIHGFCMEGKIQDAQNIFDQMKLRGWKPDAPLYGKLIAGLCAESRSEDAASLLDEMALNDVVPNRATKHIHENMHNVVVQGLCKEGGRQNKAFQVYLNMVNSGICPSFETLNLMVDRFCKRGDVDKVDRILRDILANGFLPNSFTWAAIVRAFWKKGNQEEAGRKSQAKLVEESLHQMMGFLSLTGIESSVVHSWYTGSEDPDMCVKSMGTEIRLHHFFTT
ncbi:hypothetical protein SUGI_0011420 [Cryptomeria japonica]|nr:hypothetical protein SUGI_0011420 [Cryptomeria japonica]